MSSEFGKRLKVSIFGESHGKAIGAVISGLPAGEKVDMDRLGEFMARRRPGQRLSTGRSENDIPSFVSGIKNGVIEGSPICAVIENSDTRSSDYSEIFDKPRPGHADYTAHIKYGGSADMAGGGHFSGRLTAPLCAAGGIALQILEKRGIYIGAQILSVGPVYGQSFDGVSLTTEQLLTPGKSAFPALGSCDEMTREIEKAAADGDSVGGVVECACLGFPAGIGAPMFDGLEGRIASVIFGIPAIKGIEFGSGFSGAASRGSVNNDSFTISDGKIATVTNNHGGILGGISSGMPITFRVAVKPTPSIAKEQKTISLSRLEDTTLAIKGRHDPCIALRAVPVVEAAAALALLDLLLEDN